MTDIARQATLAIVAETKLLVYNENCCNISGYTPSAGAAIIDYCCLAGSIDSPSRVHSYTVKSVVACYVTLVFTKTTSSCACGVVHLCAQYGRMTFKKCLKTSSSSKEVHKRCLLTFKTPKMLARIHNILRIPLKCDFVVFAPAVQTQSVRPKSVLRLQ